MADRPNTNATFAQEDVMVKGSKKLLYAKLNAELGKLETNMKALEDNIKVTAAQVPSVRKMGNMHSSLFMSVNQVLGQEPLSSTNNNNNPE